VSSVESFSWDAVGAINAFSSWLGCAPRGRRQKSEPARRNVFLA